MTWASLDDKLGAKVVKSRGLEKELSEVKDTVQKENDEHNNLRVTVQLVCDELELAPEQETSSLAVRATWITDRARDMARGALRFGVHRSFVVARSHYEKSIWRRRAKASHPSILTPSWTTSRRRWPPWRMTFLPR